MHSEELMHSESRLSEWIARKESPDRSGDPGSLLVGKRSSGDLGRGGRDRNRPTRLAVPPYV